MAVENHYCNKCRRKYKITYDEDFDYETPDYCPFCGTVDIDLRDDEYEDNYEE